MFLWKLCQVEVLCWITLRYFLLVFAFYILPVPTQWSYWNATEGLCFFHILLFEQGLKLQNPQIFNLEWTHTKKNWANLHNLKACQYVRQTESMFPLFFLSTCACVASGWAMLCARGCAAGRAGCLFGRGWSCSRWAPWAASPAPGSCRACCVCSGTKIENEKANNDK